ncbi:hypothetical protein CDL60_14255 [Roseateles noduli]|nr:hypothetical protein CDL60_14255 [Roseateles noduli]
MPEGFTTSNHYVPQWYQERFIPEDRKERRYHYLDLHPERVVHAGGGFHFRKERRVLGPVNCFEQSHLYTVFFGADATDTIERNFFGPLDSAGCVALPAFLDYVWHENEHHTIHDFIDYLGAQKLRTPKGLDFLKHAAKGASHRRALLYMQQLHQVYVTMWMEAIWEVVSCDESPTKFIVTDHPVVTYNKGLFPQSKACQYPLDAPIELLGTHTIFPLSLNRCLVMTNLGYVRNPNVNPVRSRLNARSYENTVFDMRSVQTGRQLPERDVIAINYILKSRAKRYIAAAEKEWLYPERHFAKTMWNKLGDRFFLMPDPRKMHFHADTYMGFKNGASLAVDEYGRRPNTKDRGILAFRSKEQDTFRKHQKLWEAKFGELTPAEQRAIWFGGEMPLEDK